MLKTTVIKDHIHHNLQSLLVSLITKALIILVRTKAGVHLIIIGGGIAVIGCEIILGIGRIILEHRGKPKRGYAQLLKVVEVLADTIQVATMTQTGLGAILYIVTHALYLCRMIGTLCKTVGHQHIEHIGIGKAHTLIATHLTLFKLILYLGLTKVQHHRAWLCITQIHINQQVVRRIKSNDTVDDCTWIIGCYTGNIADTFSVHHQLYLRILQAYIPVGGFDTVNHLFLCCTHR